MVFYNICVVIDTDTAKYINGELFRHNITSKC